MDISARVLVNTIFVSRGVSSLIELRDSSRMCSFFSCGFFVFDSLSNVAKGGSLLMSVFFKLAKMRAGAWDEGDMRSNIMVISSTLDLL